MPTNRRNFIFRAAAAMFGASKLSAQTPELRKNTPEIVETAEALRKLPLSGQQGAQVVQTLGCNTPGDGGGGLWRWDANSTFTDDSGTVLIPSGHTGSGRWIRVLTSSTSIDVAWFGLTGSANPAANTNAFNNAFEAAERFGAGEVIFSSKDWQWINDTITVTRSFRGKSGLQSVIYSKHNIVMVHVKESFIEVSGLMIRGDDNIGHPEPQAGIGMLVTTDKTDGDIYGPNKTTIRNIVISGCKFAGFVSGALQNAEITNCQFARNRWDLWITGLSQNLLFNNCNTTGWTTTQAGSKWYSENKTDIRGLYFGWVANPYFSMPKKADFGIGRITIDTGLFERYHDSLYVVEMVNFCWSRFSFHNIEFQGGTKKSVKLHATLVNPYLPRVTVTFDNCEFIGYTKHQILDNEANIEVLFHTRSAQVQAGYDGPGVRPFTFGGDFILPHKLTGDPWFKHTFGDWRAQGPDIKLKKNSILGLLEATCTKALGTSFLDSRLDLVKASEAHTPTGMTNIRTGLIGFVTLMVTEITGEWQVIQWRGKTLGHIVYPETIGTTGVHTLMVPLFSSAPPQDTMLSGPRIRPSLLDNGIATIKIAYAHYSSF